MAEEEAAAKTEKKSLSGLVNILLAVVNLVAIGVGGFLVFSSTIGHEQKSVTESDLNKELVEFRKSLRSEPIVYSMETFNTNLDGVPRRLVRMDLSLEMLDEEGFEEIIGVEAEARDTIIKILNSKLYDELETVHGKLQLKNDIISSVNGLLDKGVVKNIYFTDLVVQ